MKFEQVGQLTQTNSAAACVSCGKNISAKSMHPTSLYPMAERLFEMLNRLGMRINQITWSECKDAGPFNK